MIGAVELVRVRLPLRTPFRTSVDVEAEREALLVRLELDGEVGWGECVAPSAPAYAPEYVAGAEAVLRHHLVPALRRAPPEGAAGVAGALAGVKGHRMAKAALETAVLDAELRRGGRSLAAFLGGERTTVPAGVAVGIPGDLAELLDEVAAHLEAGYRRVKLKVRPGWDVEPVAAVRRLVGDGVPLQVDANAAYRRSDVEHLRALDEHGLVLVEQPLPEDDLLGHAAVAERLETPVCLDESVTSVGTAATALALGACSVVNVKPGRVGGFLEARAVHDLCREAGVPVWCGGMVETGVGRAGNLALASLPGFTLVGDLGPSARFFEEDVTEPVTMEDGWLAVPEEPGASRHPDPDRLAALGAVTIAC